MNSSKCQTLDLMTFYMAMVDSIYVGESDVPYRYVDTTTELASLSQLPLSPTLYIKLASM